MTNWMRCRAAFWRWRSALWTMRIEDGLLAADCFGIRKRRLARGAEAARPRGFSRKRYRILERNLEVGDDEADLIALDPDGGTVVIVEIKTRVLITSRLRTTCIRSSVIE